MPIAYQIDESRRLVIAWVTGRIAEQMMLDYQRQVWSRPEVAGYHELVDMTNVQEIDNPSALNMRRLAAASAATDGPAGASSKFAIVAPQEMVFGLGRMYQTYRELTPNSTKEVGVFRTAEEAMAFLGLTGPLPPRPSSTDTPEA